MSSIERPLDAAGHQRSPVTMPGYHQGLDADAGDIGGLVYVNGFAPEPGESAFALVSKLPGSMLAETTLRPVPRSDCTTDLYIVQERFHDLFCADVSDRQARMAATQRPVAHEALVESSGARPLWKEVPSWFLIGERDRIIRPPCSTSWPSVPARAGRSRSRTPRTLPPSRNRAPSQVHPRGRANTAGRVVQTPRFDLNTSSALSSSPDATGCRAPAARNAGALRPVL